MYLFFPPTKLGRPLCRVEVRDELCKFVSTIPKELTDLGPLVEGLERGCRSNTNGLADLREQFQINSQEIDVWVLVGKCIQSTCDVVDLSVWKSIGLAWLERKRRREDRKIAPCFDLLKGDARQSNMDKCQTAFPRTRRKRGRGDMRLTFTSLPLTSSFQGDDPSPKQEPFSPFD